MEQIATESVDENKGLSAKGKMILLYQTKEAFASVRYSVLDAMVKLAEVKEHGIWEDVCKSFGEYVESELGISQSFASKLLSVHSHYLVQGGVPKDELAGIDYECLYLAAKTDGSPEEQISKARTLTRRELKEERNDEEPHEHIPVEICKVCSVRL